jgi:TM2 domain-containing membrane protein YozV
MTQDPNNPYGQQEPKDQNNPYGQQPPPPPYAQGGYGAPAPGYGSYFISAMGQEQGPYPVGHLAQMALSGSIKPDTMVRADGAGNWFPAKEVPGLYSDKEMVTTAIISWLVGIFGVDRFYLGYTGLGLLKLFTCGGFTIWAIIDLILIILRKVPDAQGRPLR